MWWGQPFGVVLFRVRRHGDHVGDGCGPPRVIFGEVTGEGRGLTLGGVVLTVNGDRDAVERQLGNGELACPSCGGVLGRWGNAVTRPVRQLKGDDEVVTPRRSRCRGCRATHVLLPAQLLSRRADAGAVIGRALEEKAAGSGHRVIALALGRPPSTVRGWLRSLARGAGRVGRVDVDHVVGARLPRMGDERRPRLSGPRLHLAATGGRRPPAAAVGRVGPLPRCQEGTT